MLRHNGMRFVGILWLLCTSVCSLKHMPIYKVVAAVDKYPINSLSQQKALLLSAKKALLLSFLTIATTTSYSTTAYSAALPTSFLYNRVRSFESNSYHPGLKDKDVYYPLWAGGLWKTCSRFDRYDLPLGSEVVGGVGVVRSIEKDLNSTLCYTTKFNVYSDYVLADRIANVKSISIASMGINSIIDDQQYEDPASVLRLVVRPQQQRNDASYEIKLITTDREQNSLNDRSFEVLERTTQIIEVILPKETISSPTKPQTLRKEIETITVYTQISDDMIVADQRTATFLTPLDPRFKAAESVEPLVRNSAIDIRKYTVTYDRIKT